MDKIVCLNFEDYEEISNIQRYVLKDKKFNKKLKELMELAEVYSNFQEIEDFIMDNFTEIDIEIYTINY